MTKVITAITAQKRNTQRLNISLDGEYAFSLDRLTAAWLKVGRKLSPEEIVSLQEKDEQEVAFNRALRYLSYRARSEAEMRKYLSDKGFSDHVSQTVIDRLKDERLINDPRFAQDWIDNRVSFRPRSQTQLRFELRNKGLSEDLIEDALQEADLDDIELACVAGKKLVGRYARLGWLDFRQKLGAALARRGFSYETVRSVTRQLWDECQTQTPARDQ
ncbi:MAG TPA: hypothetical protein GXX60_07400 [Anaerolineaceae bacterium]|jgi:regulatory protein|nr:hypothetical protein [Anaerolineaceae bacterium]HQL92414.1 RecX family transcriptional regulator [Anaerolineaceae bacterium]